MTRIWGAVIVAGLLANLCLPFFFHPEDIGLYGNIVQIATIGASISTLKVEVSILSEQTNDAAKEVLTLLAINGAVVFAVIVYTWGVLAGLLTLTYAFYSIYYNLALIDTERKATYFKITQSIGIPGLQMIAKNLEYMGLIAGDIISRVMVIVLAFKIYKIKLKTIEVDSIFKRYKEYLKKSTEITKFFFPATLVGNIANAFPVIIVGYGVGNFASAGLLVVALKVISLPNIIYSRQINDHQYTFGKKINVRDFERTICKLLAVNFLCYLSLIMLCRLGIESIIPVQWFGITDFVQSMAAYGFAWSCASGLAFGSVLKRDYRRALIVNSVDLIFKIIAVVIGFKILSLDVVKIIMYSYIFSSFLCVYTLYRVAKLFDANYKFLCSLQGVAILMLLIAGFL